MEINKELNSIYVDLTLKALPPAAQVLREWQALLKHPEFAALLSSGETVQKISRTESGFLIETENHIVDVEIRYKGAGGLLGPAQFDLIFHKQN
jgi:hypothetical protein